MDGHQKTWSGINEVGNKAVQSHSTRCMKGIICNRRLELGRRLNWDDTAARGDVCTPQKRPEQGWTEYDRCEHLRT